MSWFLEGGPFMWAVLFADVFLLLFLPIAWVAAIGAVLKAEVVWLARGLAGILVGLCLLPLAMGGLGYFAMTRRVEAAVAHVSPELRSEILAQGYDEASHALEFGGWSCVGIGVAAGGALLVAVGAGFRKRDQASPTGAV